jgi:hypothetical protein
MHTNDSEYNGHCCKTSQHVLAIIASYVLANFPLISPCTPMTMNAMVFVAKGCNMCSPILLVDVFEMKFCFNKRVQRRDDCHFSGCKKFNGLSPNLFCRN